MTRTVIHFVESSTFGGTEQSLLYLLAQLDRQSWRQVLFYRPEPGLAPLLERARRLNVKTKAIPWLHGTRSGRYLLEFVRSVRAEQAAVFHAHLHWPLAGKAGFLAATLAQVPAIVATAQLFLELPWSHSIHLQQKVVATQVDRYIAVSGAIAQRLHHIFHVPVSKITVIHNAIDVGQFERPCNSVLRAAIIKQTDRPVVLTVARLHKQKGQCYLLEAAASIPNAVFVLAGAGPDRSALEAQARALGIGDRVVFLGYREDVADLLASCDVFVLPSLYEGLPLTILEAMAAGKPIIATAIEGNDEAITDGRDGILVPPGNPAALADAIRAVLKDRAFGEKLAIAAKVQVRQEFSVEGMVRSVSRVYDEVLGSAGARHGHH